MENQSVHYHEADDRKQVKSQNRRIRNCTQWVAGWLAIRGNRCKLLRKVPACQKNDGRAEVLHVTAAARGIVDRRRHFIYFALQSETA